MAGRRLAHTLVVLVVMWTLVPVGAPGGLADPGHGNGAVSTVGTPTDALATWAASRSRGAQGSRRAAQETTLHRTVTLGLLPERPGEIDVEVAFDIPEGVTSLTVTISEEATVTDTNGFTRENETRYEWTRTTNHPSLTYRLPANETAASRRGRPVQPGQGYSFVDVGEWALVSTPSHGIRFSGVGEQPRLTREVAIDGDGVPGTAISYLGPSAEHTRTAANQRFRLVVPAAASPAASPDRILAAVGVAADRLRIGHRDETVLMFAAPSTVQWSSPGLQAGPNEFWVRADEPVDVPGNIWIHEYVHTRQTGTSDRSGRWLSEATAEYYASHLSLRSGLVDFADHRSHLAIGTRPEYATVTLADPATWEGTGATYWKGALVAAAVDRRIRLATNGERSLADVYRQVQDRENVSNEAFLDAVGNVSDTATRADAERYTATGAAPQLWNETQQAVAYGSAIQVRSQPSALGVTGPYRTGPIGADTPLVPNETIVLTAAVESVDDRPGRYALVVRLDGRPVDVVSGVLEPGASTTTDVERRFEATGEYRLQVGDLEEAITVREPAAVTVESLSTPERAPPDEPFPVTVVVANGADRPAIDAVTVAAEGEPVGTTDVTLGPGERNRTVVSTTIANPGRYTLMADGASGTVEITAAATPPGTAGDPGQATGDSSDVTDGLGLGFGIGVAVVALLGGLLRLVMR